MRDPCETGDNYAEGYSVGEEVEGGVGRHGLNVCFYCSMRRLRRATHASEGSVALRMRHGLIRLHDTWGIGREMSIPERAIISQQGLPLTAGSFGMKLRETRPDSTGPGEVVGAQAYQV